MTNERMGPCVRCGKPVEDLTRHWYGQLIHRECFFGSQMRGEVPPLPGGVDKTILRADVAVLFFAIDDLIERHDEGWPDAVEAAANRLRAALDPKPASEAVCPTCGSRQRKRWCGPDCRGLECSPCAPCPDPFHNLTKPTTANGIEELANLGDLLERRGFYDGRP